MLRVQLAHGFWLSEGLSLVSAALEVCKGLEGATALHEVSETHCSCKGLWGTALGRSRTGSWDPGH